MERGSATTELSNSIPALWRSYSLKVIIITVLPVPER
jgi:hypothetical protein